MNGTKEWPPVSRDIYEDLRPVLALVRVMRRFLDEVIDEDAELRPHRARLDTAYEEILLAELAPHALVMADMLLDLEDAYAGPDSAKRDV